MPGDAAKEHSEEFPVLAGSHLRMNNPALELVKTICAVLMLDGGVLLSPLSVVEHSIVSMLSLVFPCLL